MEKDLAVTSQLGNDVVSAMVDAAFTQSSASSLAVVSRVKLIVVDVSLRGVSPRVYGYAFLGTVCQRHVRCGW